MQTASTDARFLATVLEAAADPKRRDAILRAATTIDRIRMGTARDAAAILNVCSRSVERYARAGCFPRVHLSPRKVRYDLGAVERFAANGRGE